MNDTLRTVGIALAAVVGIFILIRWILPLVFNLLKIGVGILFVVIKWGLIVVAIALVVGLVLKYLKKG